MAQKPLIAVESAAGSATTVRKDAITASPNAVTGHSATQLLNESPGASWRTATDNPSDTAALLPLDETRLVGAIHGVGHNLGRHACWRTAVGTTERPAVRATWSSDGVDDHGSTTESIPDTADLTVCCAVRFPPQPVGLESSAGRILTLRNAAGGNRIRLFWEAGTAGSPYTFTTRMDNFGTFTDLGTTQVATGDWVRLAVVYDNTAGTVTIFWNGTEIGNASVTTAWVDNGNVALYVSASQVPGGFVAAEWASIVIYNSALSDADAMAWTGDIVTGDEPDIAWASNFSDGTGSTVTDATGTANLSISGGAWVSRWSPYAAYSLDTTVWGPWCSRQGLVTTASTDLASPVISAAPRHITQAFTFVWPVDSPQTATGIGPYVGPSASTADLSWEFLTDGTLRVRSLRGGDFTVTSTTNLRDGLIHYARAVLDGDAETLTLYIGSPGSAEASEGTPASVGSYDGLVSSSAGIGNGSTTQAGITISDLRTYSCVILEADDSLGEDAPAWRRDSMWAHVRFDGQIVDGVDTSRVYTGTGGLPTAGSTARTRTEA